MPNTRTNFTDAQKAEIYSRDRATCCFSGANLWLLEFPVRPGYERDWVDHVKPSARGGLADSSNGVCASATYNAKKRHNTADSVYLFRNGLPTDWYYEIFGVLPDLQHDRLNRLSVLEPHDWFFNRAIGLAYLGFDWRCYKERYKFAYKRDDQYWFAAAFKKLSRYQALKSDSPIADRGLAAEVHAREWLELELVETYDEMVGILEKIFPRYRRNYQAWASYFWDSTTPSELDCAVDKIRGSDVDKETVECIEQDFWLRQQKNH